MRHSISRQITTVLIVLIVAVIGFCIIVNSTFLAAYYTSHKQRSLENAYSFVEKAVEEDRFESSDFSLEFEKVCAEGGLTISVMSSDGTVVRSSAINDMAVREQFMDFVLGGLDGRRAETIRENENYAIYRSEDPRTQSEYLTLSGSLGDGNLIVIRTAMESIRESAELSNRFLMIVGILACAAAIIASTFIGKRIARPIRELTDLSKRMSELDFNVKYRETQGAKSEVEALGRHMNKLSASLESTISQLKTANNELMLDNERKTQIDEMRKEFLSNVSHELKTPLALIQGYAEGLRDCIFEDAESREYYLDVIIDETEKMTKMVQKLLNLNRIEFGNQQVEMSHFDITEMIRGALAQMQVMLETKGITVSFQEQTGVMVWSDEFQIEEVLTNYLSNAVNHCEGEKQIRIFYEHRDGVLRVHVENTGEPIPEDALDKVWIKFYKVDKARTRAYGGSGIGLSIVKAIMDSLNRACGVYNTADGVCFYFDLDREQTID